MLVHKFDDCDYLRLAKEVNRADRELRQGLFESAEKSLAEIAEKYVDRTAFGLDV